MARNFNGTSDYIALQTADTSVTPYAAYDLFLWFKTTAGGTTRKTIYSENNGAFRITINDGAAGRIRVTRTTPYTMESAGPWNDGEWHLIRVKQVGLSERYLYIDDMDTPVDSDTVTVATGATANKRLGCDSGGTNFFPGDIADFFFWDANISDADALALAARTKHPGRITTTTLRAWITNGTSSPGINAARTLEVATMPSFSGTSLVNGPHGETGPIGLTASTDIANAWVFDYPGTTIITAESGKHLREPGSLVDRGASADPRYVLYVTEVQGATYPGFDKHAVAYTSNDLSSWTRYGQINDQASAEDPYVVKDGDDYWLMHEAGKLYHSTDGLDFEAEDDITISGAPGGSTINSQTFWKEGGTWHLLYEPLPDQNCRYATAPAATGPWTDQGVAVDQIASTYLESIAVPDDIVKIGSSYYLLLHGDNLSGVFKSDDLATWTAYRTINQPDGAIMSTIQAGWAQFWPADLSKLMVINEAGASLGQTVSLVQMFGEAPVNLLTPADASTTSDTTPTFTWEGGTANYTLQINEEVLGEIWADPTVEVTGIATTSHTLVSALAAGTYIWRVVDANDVASEAWEFTVSVNDTATGWRGRNFRDWRNWRS